MRSRIGMWLVRLGLRVALRADTRRVVVVKVPPEYTDYDVASWAARFGVGAAMLPPGALVHAPEAERNAADARKREAESNRVRWEEWAELRRLRKTAPPPVPRCQCSTCEAA